MKHYHRRADKSSFFLEVLFPKGLAVRTDKYFLLTKDTMCFIINFALKSILLEKNSMKNNGLATREHFSRINCE
jgi:hypothetical protein